ncbi:MAG: dTDP-glucose 4,6-dehydratase [Planctomycetota bacterium]|nr:MAG: dTDP-glucose 4,6-dehydratase [Planctomycetota bacterium]
MTLPTSTMLITGGAGFIGANFVRALLAKDPHANVVVLDSLTYAGNLMNLEGISTERCTFVRGDIRDTSLVCGLLRKHAIRSLVHFAAESHVDRSILGPDLFIETNIVGTHSLLKSARLVWLEEQPGAHRFHHVSTDEVYGSLELRDAPFTEASPVRPSSPYAASKAASDHLVRAYHETFGLDAVITNCTNNYGPYQLPEKLVPLLIVNCLLGERLPVYGDGLHVRDWLHVDDHCNAILLALDRGVAGETYNIGGENERTSLEILRLVVSEIDHAFERDATLTQRYPNCPAAKGKSCAELVAFVRDRPGADRRYALDITKARTELHYNPRAVAGHNFEAAFRDTIRWYLTNDQWWKSVMDGQYREWVALNYDNR